MLPFITCLVLTNVVSMLTTRWPGHFFKMGVSLTAEPTLKMCWRKNSRWRLFGELPYKTIKLLSLPFWNIWACPLPIMVSIRSSCIIILNFLIILERPETVQSILLRVIPEGAFLSCILYHTASGHKAILVLWKHGTNVPLLLLRSVFWMCSTRNKNICNSQVAKCISDHHYIIFWSPYISLVIFKHTVL